MFVLFLALGMMVWGIGILYGCNGHEVRSSDSIAEIMDDVANNGSSGLDITTNPYTDPSTGRSGHETIIKRGDETVRIYPNGDHNITVTITDGSGNQTTTESYNVGWSEANVGELLKDKFATKEVEEEEFSG